MPIGPKGSDEHAYFRALYEDYIAPTLQKAGFEVSRADDSTLTGAISKEIVFQLASAEVVVADLTELNPNVFYEIGVRHALRRSGTILLLDQDRTPTIPFDLSGYRAILFRGDLPGAAALQRNLVKSLEQLSRAEQDHRDNPVHDWLPTLPSNALEASTGTEAGELRRQLSKSQRRLRDLERRFGDVAKASPDEASLTEVLANAQRDAKEGNLVVDLVRLADQAVYAGDREGYLQATRRIFDGGRAVDADQHLLLAMGARQLGLADVSRAIFDRAAATYPRSAEVKRRRLAILTDSSEFADRELARVEIRAELGIVITEDAVTLPKALSDNAVDLLAVMLDAYHEDGLNDEALRVTAAAVEHASDRSVVARNHARALERVGKTDEAMDWYIAAAQCQDVGDRTLIFLAATLHNRSRHVDALEAYALAATLDADDAGNLARIASEASFAMEAALTKRDKSGRSLPPEITDVTVETAILAAFSCELLSADTRDRCVKAASRAELPLEAMHRALAVRESQAREGTDESEGDSQDLHAHPMERMGFRQRYAFASSVHLALRSNLTGASVTES